LFEPIALLLLSLATVGTAWCSFQAATWSSASQRLSNLSAAASRNAVTAQLQANQFAVMDVLLFSQHINALVAGNETLSRFYSNRFRKEAKVAFDAWMATNPFENDQAPAHPFGPDLYKPQLLEVARAAENESLTLWQQAGDAGRVSRSYVLLTVLLASALFCGGTASKFETLWIRRAVVSLGMGSFGFAVCRLLLLPVQV
jgi:hypothetical protein